MEQKSANTLSLLFHSHCVGCKAFVDGITNRQINTQTHKQHNGFALGNLIGYKRPQTKKLIWFKVILLLHSFSAKANLPVFVVFFFRLSFPLQLVEAHWPSDDNFYFFSVLSHFDLEPNVNIWYYLFYVRFGFFFRSNLIQSEMKMCACVEHSFKKRVEFKHRFRRINSGFLFFGCRMKVKGGRCHRLKIQNFNSQPNKYWQWKLCSNQTGLQHLSLYTLLALTNDVSDALSMINRRCLSFLFLGFCFHHWCAHKITCVSCNVRTKLHTNRKNAYVVILVVGFFFAKAFLSISRLIWQKPQHKAT